MITGPQLNASSIYLGFSNQAFSSYAKLHKPYRRRTPSYCFNEFINTISNAIQAFNLSVLKTLPSGIQTLVRIKLYFVLKSALTVTVLKQLCFNFAPMQSMSVIHPIANRCFHFCKQTKLVIAAILHDHIRFTKT